jgi:hypothetical protein
VTGVALLTAIYGAQSAAYAPDAADGTFIVPAFQDAFRFAAVTCLAAVVLALVRGRAPDAVRSR